MANRLFLLIALVFPSMLSLRASAIPEQDYARQMNEAVIPFVEGGGIARTFAGVGGHMIQFYTYQATGPNGAIVIAPGRTESWYKWREIIFDLAQEGFGPIYALDHRGQGFSGRLAGHPQRGHVDRFQDYVFDFETLMAQYVLPETKGANLFLLAHSMGAAISGFFVLDNPGIFKAAAYYTPMFGINLGNYKPWEAEALLNLYCAIGKCKEYAPGKTDYDPNRVFEDDVDGTNSRARWEFYETVMKANPAVVVGGPTNGWVLQSVRATRKLRRNAKNFKVPLLVYAGELDQTVLNSDMEQFCRKARDCRFVMVEGGKHQTQNETDDIRGAALDDTVGFFLDHQ